MSKVIEVENLSKVYRLGQINTGTLSQDISRRWALLRGKEDSYLKIGETNDRTVKGESDFVLSLKDINFSVEAGQAVGIIGRNGAGKSTLLKILSQITGPTTGSVKVKGRISSLLEVGTGFHPELSGRENIFLNGAILGMRKKEITSKFDEIVDFSGVERYIDTPVKRYSSGMYVRLAFAVAAHLESEILIVDEVLAVGDAEFQKKCLGKMGEVSMGGDRTVLFVSHNLTAIRNLCSSSILLVNGELKAHGSTIDVLNKYHDSSSIVKTYHKKYTDLNALGNDNISILQIALINSEDEVLKNINTRTDIFLSIQYKTLITDIFGFTLVIKDTSENIVFSSISNIREHFELERSAGEVVKIVCHIPANLLNDETYKISLMSFNKNFSNSSMFDDVMQFNVEDGTTARGNYSGKFSGMIRPELNWYSR